MGIFKLVSHTLSQKSAVSSVQNLLSMTSLDMSYFSAAERIVPAGDPAVYNQNH